MKAAVVLGGVAIALLLGGCPDNRLPKPPPHIPQPKVDAAAFHPQMHRPARAAQRAV